jgi:hypothetical protein
MKMTMNATMKETKLQPEDDGLGAGWRDGFFEEAVEFEEEKRREETKEAMEQKTTKSHKKNQRRRRRFKPRVKMEAISENAPMMWVTARWTYTDYLKMTEEEKEQMTDQEKKNLRSAWKTLSKKHADDEADRVEADRYDCHDNQPVATTWMKMENKRTEEWKELMKEKALKETEEYMAIARQEKNMEEEPRKGWTTMELITMKDMEWKMESRTRKRVPPHEQLAWNTHSEMMRQEYMESKEKTINLAIHRKKYKRVTEELITRVEAMADCVNNQPEATAKESKRKTKTKSKKKRGRVKKHEGKRKSNKLKMKEALDERTWTGETTTCGKRYFWNRGRPPERTPRVTVKTTNNKQNKGYHWYRGRPPEQ